MKLRHEDVSRDEFERTIEVTICKLNIYLL